MYFKTEAFLDGDPIPPEYAFGRYDPQTHVTLSDNKNPDFTWGDLPEGTQSLALICHDRDVPCTPEDVNQVGKYVSVSLPRVDFYHWVLVDLAPQPASIAVGEFSNSVTPRGKSGPAGPRGTRQGINNYREWFEGNAEMAGNYFGYDGPCPPWNDRLIHRYVFSLYALDVAHCAVEDLFTGPDVLDAIDGHIIDKAAITCTYTLSPKLRKTVSTVAG